MAVLRSYRGVTVRRPYEGLIYTIGRNTKVSKCDSDPIAHAQVCVRWDGRRRIYPEYELVVATAVHLDDVNVWVFVAGLIADCVVEVGEHVLAIALGTVVGAHG